MFYCFYRYNYIILLDEVKNYLNFIRGMGIKAWIPGSSKSYPEMSVADQCRSGVLCLNYKGSDIYSTEINFIFIDNNTVLSVFYCNKSFLVLGNNHRTTNDKISTGFVKNLDNGSSKNDKVT